MPRLDGIDIAHYQWDQGPVDLGTVAAIPTFWLATKATQSTTYVDPTFAKARTAAHAAGFTHVGLYHWLSSITDPVMQADHFLDSIGTLRPGEFAMLDAEERGITADGCVAFCERVEQVTRRPVVVYSGLYVSGGIIWRSTPLRASQYGPRPFIVAAYVTAENLEARMRATGSLPNFVYQAWQYSSNGPVAGIVGRCDMDMVVDRAAFDLACGITVPQPSGDDMQIRLLVLTDSDAQFLAETTGDGRALNCRWVGTAKLSAARDAHRAAAAGKQAVFEQSGDIAGLINVALIGPLPVGDSRHTWTGSEFSAFEAGISDPTVVAALNDVVGRHTQDIASAFVSIETLGKTQGEMLAGARRMADAGKGP